MVMILPAAAICVAEMQSNDTSAATNFTGYTAISTPQDLAKIGNDAAYPLSGKYYLTNDIDFAGVDTNGASNGNFTPMGSSYSVYFSGTFDGNGHVISGINISVNASSNDTYAGLFGYVANCTISNLGIVGGSIASTASYGNAYAGGIASYARTATIDNCYNTCSVTATVSGDLNNSYAGGIAGQAGSTTVKNCYNTGSINASSSAKGSYAGGIAGVTYSSVECCYNAGPITASVSSGYQGARADAGGIAAQSSSTIDNCSNSGSIKASSLGSATYPSAGGIIGEADSSTPTVENCYSIGSITASKSISYDTGVASAGGIAGSSNSMTISHCYFLSSNVSGGNTVGRGTPNVNGSGGKSVSNLTPSLGSAQNGNTTYYTGTGGWDFSNTWTIVFGENHGYPMLISLSDSYPETPGEGGSGSGIGSSGSNTLLWVVVAIVVVIIVIIVLLAFFLPAVLSMIIKTIIEILKMIAGFFSKIFGKLSGGKQP